MFLRPKRFIRYFGIFFLADTLDAEIIAEDLASMADLLDALEPLKIC